jgi:hypothetical protein
MQEDEWIFERLGRIRRSRYWTFLWFAGTVANGWGLIHDSGWVRLRSGSVAVFFLVLFLESLPRWRKSNGARD